MKFRTSHLKQITISCFILFSMIFMDHILIPKANAQSSVAGGTMVAEIRIEGLRLIEKGLIFSSIKASPTTELNPMIVSDDIKTLFKMGYFNDVRAEIEQIEPGRVALIYRFEEKPKIVDIEITGHTIFSGDTLHEKLKTYQNNLLNIAKIEQDVKAIEDAYREKGYMQTQVTYDVKKVDNSSVSLLYSIKENPQVYLTDIIVTGTEAYPPLDIKRLMTSMEVDCVSMFTDSGVFQEAKINQDLQIIGQHYYSNGFIKVVIDKPEVTLIRNPDYSKIQVELNINEGAQYHSGVVKIESADGNELLLDPNEFIEGLSLQSGEVFNPYNQNADRFKINELYQSRGYAFSRVSVQNNINEEDKTVDTTYSVVRGEKAYFGRIEVQGNYETRDDVIRRELTIRDNELFDGVKLRESQQNVFRLGFFDQQGGVSLVKTEGEEESTLNYNLNVKEGQTGSFNGSLTYSGYSGLALAVSISKENIFGTGRSATLSIQYGVTTDSDDDGETSNSLALTTPYWLDTNFTNSIELFNNVVDEDYYYVNRSGFDFGLSYPIWKNWYAFGNLNYTDETYSDITDTGTEYLDGATSNTSRSFKLGGKYSSVNNNLFPTDGMDASMSIEHFGGVLTGSVNYQEYVFDANYYKTLSDDGTVVFNAGFNWSRLYQINPNVEIPYHKRYTIGGITTVRGFDWYDIEGPSSEGELGKTLTEFVEGKWPYQGDFDDCTSAPCTGYSTTKSDDRAYFERHRGGIEQKILNFNLLFPLTREGQNLRGVVFFDAGNVWSEDRMYSLAGVSKDDWYLRKSTGLGIRIITPMGVFRFEYGIKLDQKANESPSQFDFYISGLF